MVRAELLGRHTHRTLNEVDVHIWIRGGKYLARGRYECRPFGLTLGNDQLMAESRLRQLLQDIENGVFVRPSESVKRPHRQGPPARLPLRDLIDRFLAEKRKLRGKQTCQDYHARLMPLLEFAEAPANRKRWPFVHNIDRAFAVDFRSFLMRRQVSANGHPVARPRRMTAGHIHNVLTCTSTLLNWAKAPEVNLLPMHAANPFGHEIVGHRPRRDPLAPPPIPMSLRIEMVKLADLYQLAVLALPLVLPNRPEEFAGLLVEEVVFHPPELAFGTRLGGDDFNKCAMTFRLAWPRELEGIIRWWIGDRITGPLLLRRTVVDGRRRPELAVRSPDDLFAAYQRQLASAPSGSVQAMRDRKDVFRKVLRQLGGVDTDDLAGEFKALLQLARPDRSARCYDLRGSTLTDLKDARVDPIFRRYITAHSLSGEILGSYESHSLHKQLEPYFEHIRPLLSAIAQRGQELGLRPRP